VVGVARAAAVTLTDRERHLLLRRKAPDLTFTEFCEITVIQLRALAADIPDALVRGPLEHELQTFGHTVRESPSALTTEAAHEWQRRLADLQGRVIAAHPRFGGAAP
jgi:hypothetical protein